MTEIRTLRMGAMERWGDVRIGVMSANDDPGAENVRLRVMTPEGASTVRVLLGGSVDVEGAGVVTLHELALHHPREGEESGGPPRAGQGSVEISFRPQRGGEAT